MSASVISGIGELKRLGTAIKWNWGRGRASQEKYHGKCEAKASNRQIDPLHIFQSLFALAYINEDDVGSQSWSYHRAYAIECLRNVDTYLRESWRTADCDVWVGSSFERAESIADDEYGSTEAAKGFV